MQPSAEQGFESLIVVVVVPVSRKIKSNEMNGVVLSEIAFLFVIRWTELN